MKKELRKHLQMYCNVSNWSRMRSYVRKAVCHSNAYDCTVYPFNNKH